MIEYGEKTIEQITADTIRTARTITAGAKKYIRVCAGYDTETTRKENKSYIYHFAISFNKSVFGLGASIRCGAYNRLYSFRILRYLMIKGRDNGY